MSNNLIKEIIQEAFKENIMNNLDSAIIFKYIQELEQENKQLKDKLKGVQEERDYLFNKQSIENKYLTKENNQLKEKIKIKQDDFKCANEEINQLKERITYLENSNNRREETIISLRHEQQLDLYKEVIEEVRECIKDTCYYPELENYSNMTSEEVKELLQILDKAKENK